MVLSARSAEALDVAAANLGEHLSKSPTAPLADVSFTTQIGRVEFPHRRVVVASDAADAASVLSGQAAARAQSLGLARPLFVDCSHGNSGKDHRRQGGVLESVLDQHRNGDRAIAGVLLESHLRAGRQVWTPGQAADPSRSITDSCMGWEETEARLDEAARAVRSS